LSKEKREQYILECSQLLDEIRTLVQLAIDDITFEEQKAEERGYSAKSDLLMSTWDSEKQELDNILQTLWNIDFGARYENY